MDGLKDVSLFATFSLHGNKKNWKKLEVLFLKWCNFDQKREINTSIATFST
jgi:hypothetical protein